MPRTVIVLAAHGSRLADANEAHVALCARVADRVAMEVVPGFLEIAEPTIRAAIDATIASGADRVLVLPYFLHPGNHTAADIPAIVEDAQAAHPDVEIGTLALFGADGRMAEVVAEQVRAVERSA